MPTAFAPPCERELAFRNAYLTWNEEAQALRGRAAARSTSRPTATSTACARELDEVQERIDVASLNSEEWNVLYRLRLQLEQVGAAEAASD